MADSQVLLLRGAMFAGRSPSAGSNTEAGSDADGESQALVSRAQAGDLRAFEQLVNENQAAIASVVTRIMDGPDDVEDVVQETFVQAFQHIRSFRGQARFSTWLHRIAVNTALKRLKQIRNRRGVSLDDPNTGLADLLEDDSTESPPDIALRHEREVAVRRAVSSLSDKHRIVVALRYFEDYSCEEIAGMLGCSVGTVWSRLHYACKQLKSQLGWVVE